MVPFKGTKHFSHVPLKKYISVEQKKVKSFSKKAQRSNRTIEAISVLYELNLLNGSVKSSFTCSFKKL